jgi:type II secretory pathway pseudopilin PulG
MLTRNKKLAFSKRLLPRGAVLAEVIMVVFIISLFTAMAMINLSGALAKDSFKSRADKLVRLFQMAATSAAETGKRYEIIIDFTQYTYTLREITTGLVAVEDILEEEIIETGEFTDRFQPAYVLFDDGDWTNSEPALFRVGKFGWQNGGKISLLDESGNEYTLIINRLSRMIELYEGDVEIVAPRTSEEMGF